MSLTSTIARLIEEAVRRLVPLCLLFVATSCDGDAKGNLLPDPAASSRIELAATDGFPCRIVIEPTGVELRSDRSGNAPDPIRRVERGPDGRFFTPTNNPAEIAVWSPEGRFLSAIGEVGEGPGEFGPLVDPVVAPDGSLYVFDGMGRSSRFAPDGSFIESITSPGLVTPPGGFLILTDGSVVIAQPNGLTDPRFRVVDTGGEVHSFGTLRGVGTPTPGGERTSGFLRSVASTRDSAFWTAPWRGFPGGYVLEEWSTDGRLLRALQRTPSWFPDVIPSPGPDRPRPPSITIQSTGGDLLIVSVLLKWGDRTRASEGWLKVIDTSVPEVLASRKMVYEPEDGWPLRFFRESRMGYRMKRDSLDLVSFVMYEYELDCASSER